MSDGIPHYYYRTPDAKPMLVEIIGDRVYEMDGDRARALNSYTGTFVRLIPEPQMPQADWSTAPDWAMFHAINANGTGFWYEHEPHYGIIGWGKKDGRWHGDTDYSLPLGIDWRQTKQQRPAAARAPGGGSGVGE